MLIRPPDFHCNLFARSPISSAACRVVGVRGCVQVFLLFHRLCLVVTPSLALGSDLTALLPPGPLVACGSQGHPLSGERVWDAAGLRRDPVGWVLGCWLMCSMCARELSKGVCWLCVCVCVSYKCVHVGWCTVDVCVGIFNVVPSSCCVTGPPGRSSRSAGEPGGVSKPCWVCM